jgi:GT2 family glycosyltransferase
MSSLPTITVSIVSHLQSNLVKVLLDDIQKCCKTYPLNVLLTLNLPEELSFNPSDYAFPIKLLSNSKPKGFAANHNQAFLNSNVGFFCILNPDIRINKDPFHVLISCFENPNVGIVAPLVVNVEGQIEDSARCFPTPFKIICKVIGRCKDRDYVIKSVSIYPDWVGGMFMLIPCDIFKRLGGFNEGYFLYYEDVDLCARLRLMGYEIVLSPAARVIHDARRSSHKNLRYLRLHLSSMLRFFCSSVFIQIIWEKLIKVFIR